MDAAEQLYLTRSQAAVRGPTRRLTGIGTSGRLARLRCMRHLRLHGHEEIEQNLVREPLRRRLQVGAQQRGVIGRQLEVPSRKAAVDPAALVETLVVADPVQATSRADE